MFASQVRITGGDSPSLRAMYFSSEAQTTSPVSGSRTLNPGGPHIQGSAKTSKVPETLINRRSISSTRSEMSRKSSIPKTPSPVFRLEKWTTRKPSMPVSSSSFRLEYRSMVERGAISLISLPSEVSLRRRWVIFPGV